MDAAGQLIARLPPWLGQPAARALTGGHAWLTELRLKAGRNVLLYGRTGCKKLSELSGAAAPTEEQLRTLLLELSDHSLAARTAELENGYLTLSGGHRAAVCGNVINGRVMRVSSLNIRVARQVLHCGAPLYRLIDSRRSILLAGPVASGKTTVLRDLARYAASAPHWYRTAIVDERREIAAMADGLPQLDVGEASDILDGVSRRRGFSMAIRTLAPDYIVCDEIGSADDLAAIRLARLSGCQTLATLHAGERSLPDDITGYFDCVAFLGTGEHAGKIKEIRENS